MTIHWNRVGLAAATLALGIGFAGITVAQTDPIKARQELYKANGGAMRAIKAAVDANGPAAAVVPEAAKLVNTFKTVPAHFPAGSEKGETKASADIWKNKADFDQLNANALAAATKLETDAKAGDMTLVAADFRAVGATCGACHDKYRLK
jgi:cytochrome c556